MCWMSFSPIAPYPWVGEYLMNVYWLIMFMMNIYKYNNKTYQVKKVLIPGSTAQMFTSAWFSRGDAASLPYTQMNAHCLSCRLYCSLESILTSPSSFGQL